MKEAQIFAAMQRALARTGADRGKGVVTGAGFDAAVLSLNHRLVVSTDLSVEGTHFDLDLCSPRDAAWRAVMLAASDLAPLGAVPRFLLMSVALPPGASAPLVKALAQGTAEAAAQAGMAMVGGDTTRGPCVVMDVVVLGEQVRPLDPTAVQSGDTLALSAPTGQSALALERLLAGDKKVGGALLNAYTCPSPDFPKAARLLRHKNVVAMTDVSDGLVRDAGKMAGFAGLGVALNETAIPLPPDLGKHPPLHYALHGGDEACWLVAFRGKAPPGVTPMGTFVEGKGKVWLVNEHGRRRPVKHHGFDHF